MNKAEETKAEFTQKVQACYEAFQASWQKLQPKELIAQAGEIHTIQQLAKELPNMVSDEDMAYLLRFKDPLEVATDAWLNSVSYSISEEELDHVLWDLRDRQYAESDYEMEPEQSGDSMLSQTM